MPGGAEVTSLRSNIPAISEYVYSRIDKKFVERAKIFGGGIIVGGENYGQGSSREHAALAPRFLGVIGVLAKSFARIHRGNLINFGIVPLIFKNPKDYNLLKEGNELVIDFDQLIVGKDLMVKIKELDKIIYITHDLTKEEIYILRAGGRLEYIRKKIKSKGDLLC